MKIIKNILYLIVKRKDDWDVRKTKKTALKLHDLIIEHRQCAIKYFENCYIDFWSVYVNDYDFYFCKFHTDFNNFAGNIILKTKNYCHSNDWEDACVRKHNLFALDRWFV